MMPGRYDIILSRHKYPLLYCICRHKQKNITIIHCTKRRWYETFISFKILCIHSILSLGNHVTFLLYIVSSYVHLIPRIVWFSLLLMLIFWWLFITTIYKVVTLGLSDLKYKLVTYSNINYFFGNSKKNFTITYRYIWINKLIYTCKMVLNIIRNQ